jgi:hypothetical protein
MKNAMKNLWPESLDVIHSGDATFPMAPGIRAVASARLLEDLKPIGA